VTDGHRKEICGGEANTTNNRMEMTAVIRALESLKRPSTVEVHTDSQYVQKGISEWMAGWKRRNWRTADGKPVKNQDLWLQLDSLPSCTASNGNGCAATPAIPKTNAPTNSPTRACCRPNNTESMRQIILDTETTGLDPNQGHRIIEVAAVEMVNRRLTGNHLHRYVNPDRDIDAGAMQVHGITPNSCRTSRALPTSRRNSSTSSRVPNSSFTMRRSTSAFSTWSCACSTWRRCRPGATA
jgi:hypothetical protein